MRGASGRYEGSERRSSPPPRLRLGYRTFSSHLSYTLFSPAHPFLPLSLNFHLSPLTLSSILLSFLRFLPLAPQTGKAVVQRPKNFRGGQNSLAVIDYYVSSPPLTSLCRADDDSTLCSYNHAFSVPHPRGGGLPKYRRSNSFFGRSAATLILRLHPFTLFLTVSGSNIIVLDSTILYHIREL